MSTHDTETPPVRFAFERHFDPETAIREYLTDDGSDGVDLEGLFEALKVQPVEFPDSGGDMATDEVPGYRDRLLYGFGMEMAKRGELRLAAGALGEIGDYGKGKQYHVELTKAITEGIPFA